MQIAVVLRGTCGEEWYSNFEIGYSAEHSGFARAADFAELRLADYVFTRAICIQPRFFITGYSRGGAVANILAKRLCDRYGLDYVSAYTFAAPSTTISRRTNRYSSIFNIVRGEDFFTRVPLESWGYTKYGKTLANLDLNNPYGWSQKTVSGILEDETYLGHTINLRFTTISYKNKRRIERPLSEQLRFENTHEPLVDKQTWEIVQDIRKHKRRRANFAEQNMFSGLVYCADCGGTMVLHRAHTMDAVKNNFMCSTYKKKGKEVCSGHYIREVELAAVLLDDIRRITHFARQNELRFAEYIGVKQGKEAQREIAALQKKATEMERRKAELSAIFKRLYEDSVLGRIPEEQYRLLSRDYTREQAELDEALPKVTEQLQKLKDSAGNVSRFLENAR